MIKNWFPSKRETTKKAITASVSSHTKDKTDAQKAEARNLSLEEYQNRCAIVSDNIRYLNYKPGAELWPRHADNVKKYGKCKVTAICYHYDHYGTVSWDADAPLLVNFFPLDDPKKNLVCSVDWLTTLTPDFTEEDALC